MSDAERFDSRSALVAATALDFSRRKLSPSLAKPRRRRPNGGEPLREGAGTSGTYGAKGPGASLTH